MENGRITTTTQITITVYNCVDDPTKVQFHVVSAATLEMSILYMGQTHT